MSQHPTISIAGTGNVAYHLGIALAEIFPVNYILGRNQQKGQQLAKKLNSVYTESLNDLNGSDLIICCYSDDSLKEQIPLLSKLAPTVSTSGTIDVLSFEHSNEIGVFYPLQSFSGSDPISFQNLPLFIEASTDKLKDLLFLIADKIHAKAVEMNAEDRVKLHVTAVFTNNFTNHIIDLAQQFAAENNIDYKFLLPLLDKTVEKIHSSNASLNQTGPARRNDLETIKKHLALLDAEKQKIYKLLTESIQKQHS